MNALSVINSGATSIQTSTAATWLSLVTLMAFRIKIQHTINSDVLIVHVLQ